LSTRTLIIGSGQAGVQLAVSLRLAGYQGEIQMVGKESHLPYQRPPLSKQILKKEWAAERCQLRHLDFFEKHDIKLLPGVTATRLDVSASQVDLDDGSSLQYDNLAICTGSRLNRLNIAGSDLPGVCYLRTIDHALELASRLKEGVRVAIIGGGYIGLEVAAAARIQGCEVTVIEALDQVMKRSALPEIAEFLHRRHENEGVSFRMNSRVSAIQGDSSVSGVELEDGSVIDADVVMVGVGVRPELRWLEGSGIDMQRGVKVDQSCRTNFNNIYAAGDVTELCHPLLQGWQVLESVQNAVSQGKIIAANIQQMDASYSEVPWFWSEQYDCRLQMAGIPRQGDVQVKRVHPDTGGLSIFSVSDKQLIAVQSVNAPLDYMIGRQLITKQIAVQEEKLADITFNLKEWL
jgi:3-phenylpropionate/trans-cinnamate dioxygenase ferredoxin reductase subunit